jgi:FixJ family two-component response regulator
MMLYKEPLIAIIDDDESFRTALVACLGSLGYGAWGFASAEEFIAEDAEGTCSCVITDVHMTGMSGFDLARLLTSRSRQLPVVMITARSEPGLDARAASTGAVCLLRKPFKTDVLIDCIERALKP